MSNSLPRPRPLRRSISDIDLIRLVDAVAFGDQISRLTPLELEDARKTDVYRMLQRLGCTMYRAGEQGLRPRPALQVVEHAPKGASVPADDEQPQPAL